MIVELDGPDRRVLDVELLERITDRLPVRLAVLLERQLNGRHDGVFEGERSQAAVYADRRLPALEPPLLPFGVERGRPERGFDHAVADRRVVLGEVEELDGRDAAAGEGPLLQAELAVLPEEDARVAREHDEQDGIRAGAFDLREQRTIVGLSAVEELGRDELDPELLERGVVRRGGAP